VKFIHLLISFLLKNSVLKWFKRWPPWNKY
jgi:hypothetical protein